MPIIGEQLVYFTYIHFRSNLELMKKITVILCTLLLRGEIMNARTAETDHLLVTYKKLASSKPQIEGKNVRVWSIRQNQIIRINLVEMFGELALHKHPDADHSLMVLEGRVRVQVGEEKFEITKGDFISIPANIPHKYWCLTETAWLVSMDAPYYDPKKTISLE